jgi:hypothetical protein
VSHYNFGGNTCSCNAMGSCSDCTNAITSFCGDPGGGPGPACKAGGSVCQSFQECCSGTCANQICTTCGSAGQSCNGGGCCQGLDCYEGVCNACIPDGKSCNLASDCCSNICHSGSCEACHAVGESCTSSAECCGGVACTGGVCGGSDAQCASSGDCRNCCNTNHPVGFQQLNSLLVGCTCKPGVCQTECATTLCTSITATPTQACYDCFTQKYQSACAQAEATCQQTPDCDALVQCTLTCM